MKLIKNERTARNWNAATIEKKKTRENKLVIIFFARVNRKAWNILFLLTLNQSISV